MTLGTERDQNRILQTACKHKHSPTMKSAGYGALKVVEKQLRIAADQWLRPHGTPGQSENEG